MINQWQQQMCVKWKNVCWFINKIVMIDDIIQDFQISLFIKTLAIMGAMAWNFSTDLYQQWLIVLEELLSIDILPPESLVKSFPLFPVDSVWVKIFNPTLPFIFYLYLFLGTFSSFCITFSFSLRLFRRFPLNLHIFLSD